MSSQRNRPVRQLAFELPHQPAHSRADFLVGAANYTALALIESWPRWPSRTVLLTGPSGSGKTHLAAIWRDLSGAIVIPAAALGGTDHEVLLEAGALAAEDIDSGADEAALFHLINLARERDAALLLTSRSPPSGTIFALPDLVSRLRAAQPVALAEPDDDLLAQVLVKLFADRQLGIDRALVDYIVRRAERSLAAANALVDHLDRASLESRSPINRALVQRVLAELSGGPDGAPTADG